MAEDGAGRARVRSLSSAEAMEIHPICNLSVGKYAVDQSGGAITTESWMKHFIAKGLAALEGMLESSTSGRFCHGEVPTMADICLVPQVYNARRWGVDLAAMPRILSIDAAMAELEAVKAAHPDHWGSA